MGLSGWSFLALPTLGSLDEKRRGQESSRRDGWSGVRELPLTRRNLAVQRGPQPLLPTPCLAERISCSSKSERMSLDFPTWDNNPKTRVFEERLAPFWTLTRKSKGYDEKQASGFSKEGGLRSYRTCLRHSLTPTARPSWKPR